MLAHKPFKGCEFKDVSIGGLVSYLLQLDKCLQGYSSMNSKFKN